MNREKIGRIRYYLPLVLILVASSVATLYFSYPYRKGPPHRPPVFARMSTGEKIELSDVVLNVRSGLPVMQRKLVAGEPITIVFLGGSITENAVGFSQQVPERLQKKFSRSTIRTINAGWGGTNSTLGAARVEREVLAHQPDMVFVEFAVNDASDPQIEPIERIVRKIWTASPNTDIAFLYSLAQADLGFYKKGKFPPTVSVHERVAAHYGIPGIAMGMEVAQRLRSGTITWEQFSRDSVHPTTFGHELYTDAIIGALEVCLTFNDPQKHSLPAPLTPGFLLHSPPVPAEPLPKSGVSEMGGKSVARVYELPLPGRHWVGDADWKIDDEPVWRIYAQPMLHPESLDSTIGLDRSNWQHAEWLEEAGFFIGQSNRWIAGGRGDKAGDFGANSKELAVVTFIAPAAGNYVVEFGAEALGGFSAESKSMAINVVRFSRDAKTGESVAFHTSSKAAMKRFASVAEVQLERGDELAFVFLVKDIGGGAFYHGFRATVGLLSEKK